MKTVAGTLSAIIAQFLLTFGTWILAAHLDFSPILAVVALAAVAAREMPKRTSARDRINSNAVWSTVTFVLNVLAFLLMGLQARVIVTDMRDEALSHALALAGLVLAAVILVRFVWVMAYGVAIRRFRAYFERRTVRGAVPDARVGVLVSWCGMRGLVTLATALALPAAFPHRDEIVLSAFTVVLGTLVLQGFTIHPLIGWLRIPRDDSLDREIAAARREMLAAGIGALSLERGAPADQVRAEFVTASSASVDRARPDTPQDAMRRAALKAERELLVDWRQRGRIPDDVYHHLEDELDRLELEITSSGATWLES
jgi:CPA1 family monovalent cation:H+ antiporter